jgi:hypothetical protein
MVYLDPKVLPWIESEVAWVSGYNFQQDVVLPAHTSKLVQNWLQEKLLVQGNVASILP